MARSNGIQFGEYAVPIPNHEQYTRIDKRTGSGVLTQWSQTSNRPIYEPNMEAGASPPVLKPNPADMRSILLQRLAKLGKPLNSKQLKKKMDDAGITDTEDQIRPSNTEAVTRPNSGRWEGRVFPFLYSVLAI